MSVKLERNGAAALLIFDWPEQRNALGPDECREIAAGLRKLARDGEISGVVVTGEGPAFCAGGNLKGAVSRTGMSEEERRQIVYTAYQDVIRALVDMPVVTIAAIDGPAIGLGLDIALACDCRFVGPQGSLMQGWARVGFAPGTGGEWLLRLKAPHILWKLLEEQPRIGQDLAEAMNLGESSAEATARERAVQRIEKLALLSRDTIEAYVRLSRMDLRAGLEAHLAAAVGEQIKLLASPLVKARVEHVLKGGK
ncbi:enoyl-CoA hydratase/isomerase family protein [Oryzicola mucosus]|uniref:Enoyl-CoA hydratase/isomerase family protein n=1 Tax=Oryzicola mucosus TaxID=2767425 RepID=A0A8J6U1V5_9HYPH|nr:enoyl-CoA hydratase/isomerase family protein [Oryzicola mucosus]